MENDVLMRTLTLIIEFDEDYPPEWIWECHKNKSFLNGVFITTIAEGNQIKNSEYDED